MFLKLTKQKKKIYLFGYHFFNALLLQTSFTNWRFLAGIRRKNKGITLIEISYNYNVFYKLHIFKCY
jgi:hypothetical protein